MSGNNLQHVNVVVGDLDAAVAFYTDVMQMFVRDPQGNLVDIACDADRRIDPEIRDNEDEVFAAQ